MSSSFTSEDRTRNGYSWFPIRVILLALVASSGCGEARRSTDIVLQNLELVDGQRVGDLVGTADSAIVSIYAPTDCLTCNSALDRWREWTQAGEDRTHIILMTREPSPKERRALVMDHVVEYRVLKSKPPAESPFSYFIVGGAIVDFGRGLVGERSLAKRVVHASR